MVIKCFSYAIINESGVGICCTNVIYVMYGYLCIITSCGSPINELVRVYTDYVIVRSVLEKNSTKNPSDVSKMVEIFVTYLTFCSILRVNIRMMIKNFPIS